MSDINFTSFPTPAPVSQEAPSDGELNQRGPSSMVDLNEEPVEGHKAAETVLSLLGVDDATGIPPEDLSNLQDVTDYVVKMVEKRGAVPTKSTMRRAIDSIKEEMDLDPQAEPSVVLERVGKLVQAWKGLTFIRDTSERRRLFMRLARLPSSKAIDEALFDEMERKGVYR